MPRSPDSCAVCGEEATRELTATVEGYVDQEFTFEVCDSPACTFDEALSNQSERNYESSLSDFYGGSGPLTTQEQYQAAHAERAALRRRIG